MNNLAVFADVQNIYYTTRQIYRCQFNYRRLWERISKQGKIASATAYAIDRGDPKQISFQSTLEEIGFRIKLKPFIQRNDGSAKGDWDVGIAIDIIDAAETADSIILLSGDGDFDLLLNRVKEKFGVHTEVYGVPMLTAKSLIDAADEYHPISEGLLL